MTKSVRPKEAEAQHFARDVASMLGTGLDRRQYDAVALVAPARFLGILTDSLDAQTRKRVLIRVDKDLTHIKPRDLPEHFDDVFAAATREEHRRAGMT